MDRPEETKESRLVGSHGDSSIRNFPVQRRLRARAQIISNGPGDGRLTLARDRRLHLAHSLPNSSIRKADSTKLPLPSPRVNGRGATGEGSGVRALKDCPGSAIPSPRTGAPTGLTHQTREKVRRTKDSDNLDKVFPKAVHDPIRPHDDFSNLRSIKLRHDPTRLRKRPQAFHACNDSPDDQISIKGRILPDVRANGLEIAKGFRRPDDPRHSPRRRTTSS